MEIGPHYTIQSTQAACLTVCTHFHSKGINTSLPYASDRGCVVELYSLYSQHPILHMGAVPGLCWEDSPIPSPLWSMAIRWDSHQSTWLGLFIHWCQQRACNLSKTACPVPNPVLPFLQDSLLSWFIRGRTLDLKAGQLSLQEPEPEDHPQA